MPLVSGQYSAPTPFLRFLDTNGDGTGTITGVGNFSVVPRALYIQPPATHIYVVNALKLHISDGGTFGQLDYGNIAAGTIVNGVKIQYLRGATIIADFTTQAPIIDNDGLLHYANDLQQVNWAGGADSLSANLLAEIFGIGLSLNGSLNESLRIYLNDNFTGLVDHHFVAYGYY